MIMTVKNVTNEKEILVLELVLISVEASAGLQRKWKAKNFGKNSN
jgi:hypothetical protein